MVKRITIKLDDDKFQKISKFKEKRTWEKFLIDDRLTFEEFREKQHTKLLKELKEGTEERDALLVAESKQLKTKSKDSKGKT